MAQIARLLRIGAYTTDARSELEKLGFQIHGRVEGTDFYEVTDPSFWIRRRPTPHTTLFFDSRGQMRMSQLATGRVAMIAIEGIT